ncbi:MAG: peptidase MA family metallohydrolase, partial [SAR202 cluster bacterium]|nr:peptidase MA family metallohydrolase [SAR202 cluster bacterium]
MANRVIALTVLGIMSVAVYGTYFGIANAETDAIEVVSVRVSSEFPDGLRFNAQVQGENEIDSIAVRFRIGQETRGSYEYLDFEKAALVDSELFWRTNTSARYIPPGTIITYNFEIEDSVGNRLDTEREEFIYSDARFSWEEVEEGPVAVAYHGPVKTRAVIILDSITETLGTMGPLLGADTTIPIRVTMYNNVKEMLEALPPGSSTIRRELITEGQAFTNLGTLLVLGGGTGAKGTASHEVTHILTHRAGDSVLGSVPSWLDEGLAEYGNIDPGFSYDVALEFALATGRLLPITSMPVLPGDPEEVIIFYGQARSIVKFMIAAYGPDLMRDLMSTMKTGKNVDDSIEEVYGLTRVDLENQWRETIGAPDYLPATRERLKPTPVPRAEMQLFSLTPQAGSQTVASVETTPTPTAEPTPVPEPTVTAVPTPEPVSTATPEPAVVARVNTPAAPTPALGAGSAGPQQDESPPPASSCNAPQYA